MSEQVNYQELEQLVNDQPRVHGTAFYQDARPRTQKIYDQTIQMGWDILADRNTAQPSPQTMVDMAVQSINTAIKALKSNPVLSASTPKLPKPNSVRSEVRPAEAVVSTASDQSSTTSSAPASAHEQPTQTTAAESGQLKADAHATTNSTADPAPATAPTTPQPTIAPSQPATAQPTEVTQPTADRETHSDQPGAQATAAPSAGSESVAAESAAPDTAASQETVAAAMGSTASEKSASRQQRKRRRISLPRQRLLHQRQTRRPRHRPLVQKRKTRPPIRSATCRWWFGRSQTGTCFPRPFGGDFSGRLAPRKFSKLNK